MDTKYKNKMLKLKNKINRATIRKIAKTQKVFWDNKSVIQKNRSRNNEIMFLNFHKKLNAGGNSKFKNLASLLM